jgi:superfamily II DNA or RNA helicase
LQSDFSPRIRQKGKDYFKSKAVDLSDFRDGSIRAKVQGSMTYAVKIDFEDDDVSYSCSCPFFDDRGVPCKHIWATLLAADERGLLPDSEFAPPEDLVEEDDDDLDPPWRQQKKTVKIGDRTLTLLNLRDDQFPSAPVRSTRHAVWRRRLAEIKNFYLEQEDEGEPILWPADKQVLYVIDGEESWDRLALCIELCTRQAGKGNDGNLVRKNATPKRLRLMRSQVHALPEAEDRQLIRTLIGAASEYTYSDQQEILNPVWLKSRNDKSIAREICRTGRCFLRMTDANGFKSTQLEPIQWDDGEPWVLHLGITPDESGQTYRLEGSFRRGDERMSLNEPDLISPGGPIFADGKAAALEDFGAFSFIQMLRTEEQLSVPVEQGDDLLQELLTFPSLPRFELPENMGVTEVRVAPRPRLSVSPPGSRKGASDDRLACRLAFVYGEHLVPVGEMAPAIFDQQRRQIVHRDLAFERQAHAQLRDLGFRHPQDYGSDRQEFRLLARLLPGAVRQLTNLQWHVEVSGKVYRQPGKIRMEVSSGIDWFELHGEADFGGISVKLPTLLRALSKGESTVVLDDGTVGILPEEWLKRYGLVAAMAEVKEDKVEFARNQVGLLDALLAEMPPDAVDETFARARDELRRFEKITAIAAPVTFTGTLRPYQEEGLGWMDFLRKFGLNGCLADDMGLGKTVQVLALLESRRLLRESDPKLVRGPSLVVVPRSLVFNWRDESTRFTPKLKMLDHASTGRLKTTEHFSDFDVILTTYGTLRNDVASWRDIRFDYVILDEAQAIKNSSSESAKAARLLRAEHRLALSGTPVQNHLGELWSLLEFLNPGMLGASRTFATVTGSTVDKTMSQQTRLLLAGALRPFILRRTKEQVAPELPEKFEQTIFCELDKTQRKLYDELKEHYRQSLLGRIDQEGMGKSKLQILEALLRLRQAACHPGLINKARVTDHSAKLDTLLPRLAEVAEEGHKAIVFSQFTSLLAIVRSQLDDQGAVYEYLDGKTRDRQQRVERFQNDPDCKLFLISLKAGGVGLNLTAAQYVFLLDPWWNPAVESQAIDRAHRIGQTKQVFAYRLIAKDTVEEKVLQLQQSKRDLADAIVNADNAVIGKLGREDLELLLS